MLPVAPTMLTLPPTVVFGLGERKHLPALAASLGRRVLLVSGSRTLDRLGVISQLVAGLENATIPVVVLVAPGCEPEPQHVMQLVSEFEAIGAGVDDVVVAAGGGSTLDLAKAAAAMVVNPSPGGVVDYLEGVGIGAKLRVSPLPMIAIPTTAGTGSEATRNAVISSCFPPFKKSLRDSQMMPRAVLIDPELTLSLPREVTVHSGLDAITQLVESYVSCRSNRFTQALCLEGLRLAVPAIERVAADPADLPGRAAMCQAAFLSGVALANSGLGLAHGVAAALGIHGKVPHGLACAVMLPTAIRANSRVCAAEWGALSRVFGGTAVSVESCGIEVADKATELCLRLGVPARLSDLGISPQQIPALVKDSQGNSLSGNPRPISPGELAEILESCL